MTEFDRRTLIASGAVVAGAGLAVGASAATGEQRLPVPKVLPAFAARVTLGAPIELGKVNDVRKRIVPITGGTFEGERIKGTILTGGADWQFIRADGVTDVSARYTLQASDGTPISVINAGLRRGPPEVLRRIAAGEVVDPALYYFRAATRFEVGPGPHAWLGDSVFLCSGGRFADHVLLEFYQVL